MVSKSLGAWPEGSRRYVCRKSLRWFFGPLLDNLEVARRTNGSEDRGVKVRFFPATIAFDRESNQMSQILSSQGKNAPSDPYPHYLVRLAASRNPYPLNYHSTICPKTITLQHVIFEQLPWGPKAHWLVSPDCLPLAIWDFSHALQGQWPLSGDSLQNGHFPCVAWEKSHIARGRKSGFTN